MAWTQSGLALGFQQSIDLHAGDLSSAEGALIDGAIGRSIWEIQNDPTPIGLLDGKTAIKLGKVAFGIGVGWHELSPDGIWMNRH
jgi:hypothetical protein